MTELAEQPMPTAFPKPRACPFSPPADYRDLRENAPVTKALLPSGQHAWLVSRHEDVRAALTDPRLSSDRKHPGFPVFVKDQRIVSDFNSSLIGMDAPEHGPARRAVVGEFTVKRMQALRPRIQEIVDEHIDAMLAGPRPVDLVRALSLPVPSLVICEQLGVPYSDHDFFQVRSSQLLSRATTSEQRQSAFNELRGYLDELVTAKQRDPGHDLLGRQVLKHRENGTEDHGALVGLAFLLLVAGHETTANMISLGTLTLLENPEQLRTIREDPGKTLDAVEELLRYFTIAEVATSRVALADLEIGGVPIKAGEAVVALGNSANRDPAAFPSPDEFDIERGGRHHVAFGFGAHQCLGQNLARMELQIVFDTLFERIPGLRLATTVDELSFKEDATVYGIHEMPVTW
ncbi:cytochrome P450 [Amycolatopsis nigrescens]|uniref:cytochrome P450 n=1 Tax=Amycolatopsis nigrescens TaxID=381445 RepID=UPI0003A0C483|nr:cytochrome P450 [Amycolatopsis nigrescens]